MVRHKIDTGDHKPITCKPYRVSQEKQRLIDKEIESMLEQNIIAPSDTEWASPVVLVNSVGEDGQPKRRLCIDFRKVNAITKKDPIQQPSCEEVLDNLGPTKYVTTLDLNKGYWQLGLDPETADRTGFITSKGKYVFRRLPFGLCTSQSTFLKVIDKVIPEKEKHNISNYIDDLLTTGATWEAHLANVEYLLQCLHAAGLTTRLSKAHFAKQEINLFGFWLNKDGIRPDPNKIAAIKEFKRPRTMRQLRSFLGLCSFYRKFIRNFSSVAAPLTSLTKKSVRWQWSHLQEDAFERLKSLLTHAPVLALPSGDGPFELCTDASDTGVGAVLSQLQHGAQKPVAYASRTLSDTERHLSVTEREALAAVWAVQRFRPYLESRHFVLKTDHRALLAMQKGFNVDSKLTRWALTLQAFDFTIKYVPGAQNTVADFLSRIEGDEQCPQDNSDTAQRGSTTPSQVTQVQAEKGNASVLTADVHAELLHDHVLDCGVIHHKQPPATGLTVGHPHSVEGNDAQSSDSTAWKRTAETAVCLFTQAPSTQEPTTSYMPSSASLAQQQQADADISPIYNYLKNKSVIPPTTIKEMKRKSRKYAILNNILIKNHKGHLKTVVPKPLQQSVLEHCHADISSGHFGFRRTLKKIQDQYVWPKMREDTQRYVRSCLICQQYKHSQAPPAGKMAPRKTVGVWDVCNTDIAGPYPTSARGNRYIVIFQDEYSKAIELAPLRKATSLSIAKKFVELVYARHGCPRFLKSDNGQAFCSKLLANICHVLGVTQCHILPYRPQANPAERSIKDISRILASFTGERHDMWDKNLPLIGLAVNSALQFSTQFTPYELIYGRKIRLPTLPDDHLLHGSEPMPYAEYAKEIQSFLQEAMKQVRDNLQRAHERQKRHYDAKRRSATFATDDIVWLASHHLSDAAKKFSAKLAPKRHGPFKIVQKLSDILYEVKDLRSGQLQQAHADQLQIYFTSGQPLPDEENTGTPPPSAQGISSTQGNNAQRLGAPPLPGDPTADVQDETLTCGLEACFNAAETDWVLCDLCDSPFHVACVGLTLDEAAQIDFVCPRCRSEAVAPF